MDEPDDQENHHVLPLLQALNEASKPLQIHSIYSILQCNDLKPAIEAILELGTEAKTAVSSEPSLFKLSQSLTNLKTLFEKLQKLQGCNIATLFYRQIIKFEVSQIARSIETEIQSFTDRRIVENLLSALTNSANDERMEAMVEFRNRLSRGFDGEFQELLLRGRVFNALELVLSDESPTRLERVQNQAALTVLALVEFNKDVFVGLVLMGPTIWSLISIASVSSIQVLCSLIGHIKTILVDAIESAGEIPKIINLLDSDDLRVRLAAMNVALEIAFFGTKEAVEAMIVGEGLVKKLMDLQREMERVVEEEEVKRNLARGNCVARLAVQVQVGEGLRKGEKRELTAEILRFMGLYSVSEAESDSIFAEVLWCTSSL